jgi:hypothetical protein
VAADFDELTFAFGGGDDHLNDTGYAIPLALTVDGSGNDVLGGGTLDDAVDGGPGDDTVVGTGGDDDLTGEDGNDVIRGEGGVDLLDGGDGDDYLAARENPAEADYEVSCGAGNDIVLDYSDGDPIADNCETVDPPYLDGELRITGDAREGNALGLSLPENLGSEGAATIQRERCSAAGTLCGPIPGATGSTYTITRSDALPRDPAARGHPQPLLRHAQRRSRRRHRPRHDVPGRGRRGGLPPEGGRAPDPRDSARARPAVEPRRGQRARRCYGARQGQGPAERPGVPPPARQAQAHAVGHGDGHTAVLRRRADDVHDHREDAGAQTALSASQGSARPVR